MRCETAVPFPKRITHSRTSSTNVTNLCLSFLLGVYHRNLPCKLHGVVSRSRTHPYFPGENPYHDQALTEDPSQQNYISHFYFLAFDSSFTCKYREPFSPGDAIFLPNSEKFRSPCDRVTRIFRVEITFRSPLCLECYELSRDSHLNVPHSIARKFFLFIAYSALSSLNTKKINRYSFYYYSFQICDEIFRCEIADFYYILSHSMLRK